MAIEDEITSHPRLLYKFTTVNDERRWGWFESLIRGGQIYLSSPTDFNDPFDVNPRLVFPCTEDRRYGAQLLRAGQRVGDSRAERRSKIGDLFRRPRGQRAEEYRRAAEKRIAQVGVYCVSARNDHPLMWSHYAEKHSGICVGFKSDTGLFHAAEKVQYSDTRPYYDMTEMPSEDFRAIYNTKASVWGYEEEYRLISINVGNENVRAELMKGFESETDMINFIGRTPGPGHAKISGNVIHSITFGCRATIEDRARVIALIHAHAPHVRLSQAKMSDKTFSLIIEPIDQ